MADKESEFDANERVAGFPLAGIQRALGWVGIMDDRDDIKCVAEALHCPPSQAARVLDELEKRGFVTRAGMKNQWKHTEKGWRLAHAWQSSRRLIPAIESPSTGTNLILESVPCSILRTTEDNADVFEEARVSVGVHVEYEGERLIEIAVEQPNDYDEPDGGALIDRTLYVTAGDAKS
jgi:hypothetical protein